MRASICFDPFLRWVLLGGASLLLLVSCAVVNLPWTTGSTQEALRSEQIAQSQADLARVSNPDMLLRIRNELLKDDIRSAFEDTPQWPGWRTRSISVRFGEQLIELMLEGRLDGEPPAAGEATLFGQIVLGYQSGRLAWYPRFHDLTLDGTASPGEGGVKGGGQGGREAGEADHWRAEFLGRANRDVLRALQAGGHGALPMEPMPLGILEAGVRLWTPFETVVSESHAVSGLTTVAAMATLVESHTTSLLLDLGFVSELPECEPSVDVERALFAQEVRGREPVNPAWQVARPEDVGVFYSEITGARAPTTVVHYWFADARPVAADELSIEPSARWRTWSSRPAGFPEARHWQVLVVEKSGGCVLGSHAISLEASVAEGTASAAGAAPSEFDAYARSFRARTAKFPGLEPVGEGVVVEVDRSFFAAALGDALTDLRFTAEADVTGPEPLAIGVGVGVERASFQACEPSACESRRVCTIDFDNCPVERDTRDCSTCTFRNPLNNRCLSRAEDPICLAAREAENTNLERKRRACIDWETRLRDRCELARERELAACRRRASSRVQACISQVGEVESLHAASAPIASLGGEAALSGNVAFEFSGFRIDESLGRVRMNMALEADLVADGRMRFTPVRGLEALGRCLAAAEDPFVTGLTLSRWEAAFISDMSWVEAALESTWSGLARRFEVQPQPLDTFLDRHPEALQSCAADLEPRLLPGSLSGPGAELLMGKLEIGLQPEPLRISLLPAYLQVGEQTWTGPAELDENVLRYRIGPGD